MKMEDIRSLSNDQLKQKLMAGRKEQMNLRFQKATGAMESPNRMRELRKVVARMKTELSARNSAETK